MTETELKFQIPAGQGAGVQRAVATATARRVRLAAAYADTADRRLAAAGLALRLRREGRQWVQTLKGRGDGLMQRPEHELPVSTAAAMPTFDPARHAGTAVGEKLQALLADGTPLQVIYRTEVQRTLRTVRSAGALIELAHDRGHILAAGQKVAVDELEFELKSGPPAALVALAARWVQRHGLWWDVRTKSERGFRLAEGRAQVPAVHAAASGVAAGLSGPAVLSVMLMDALGQVLPNGAELAAGTATPEHLHQLRVGLRRLRSVLREAAPLAAGEEAVESARTLERDWAEPFGILGAARDADALSAGLWPELEQALAVAGAAPLPLPPAAEVVDPGAVIRSPAVQQLLLRSLVLAQTLQEAAAQAEPLDPSLLAGLLKPLWKRSQRAARDLAAAEPESLHGLRKRLKRLRYLLEALAPLLRRKALARFLDGLRPALNRLGELNDLHTAEVRLQAGPELPEPAWFALGFLAARRQALLPLAQRALDRAFANDPPWR